MNEYEFEKGVYYGKFLPPHKGHVRAILNAAARCRQLFVVVSFRRDETEALCEANGLPFMDWRLRWKWLAQEFSNMPHIKVVMLDESDLKPYPNDWKRWCELLKKVTHSTVNVNRVESSFSVGNGIYFNTSYREQPVPIDAIFGGEPEYGEQLAKYIPEARFVLFGRDKVDISATKIRSSLFRNWEMLIGASRPYFCAKVLVTGVESCVDAETEYFNGVRWVRMDEYVDGDKVLQYDEFGKAELVTPLRRVVNDCSEMLRFSNTYSTWEQVLTPDHDMVYVTSKGNLAKKKAKDVFAACFHGDIGFKGKIPCSFEYSGDVTIPEAKLRLMVAVCADGTKARRQWTVRVKKERKKERMRELLAAAGLPVDERPCRDGFVRFWLPAEYGLKTFSDDFVRLSADSRSVFVDEIFRWDGNVEAQDYWTTDKRNAEVVQFNLAASGLKTCVYADERAEKPLTWRVHASSVRFITMTQNADTRKKRDETYRRVKPVDGKSYCFTVPSGMLVLRRNGHIFITGNCGKTTLCKALAKFYNTSWSEEAGRLLVEQDLCRNENIITSADYRRIIHRQLESDEAAYRAANVVTFIDTDAVVTEYYATMYGGVDHRTMKFIRAAQAPETFDLILYMEPDVPWVPDGMRTLEDQEKRATNSDNLFEAYRNMLGRDMYSKLVSVQGSYSERLDKAIQKVQDLLYG